jgi:hypothetical protein
VWRDILPRLEDVVNRRKRARLERERNELLGTRAQIISLAYDGYKKTLSPRSWAHVPAFQFILLSDPFWNLYNDPSDDPLDPATCADGISQLPMIISAWTDELRNTLTCSVPVQHIPFPIEPEDRSPILVNLELATSVFTCHGCHQGGMCLIGWEGVQNHLGCPRMFGLRDNILTASRIGHYAALSVIYLLDLDGQTVTAKELDECDARLLCGNCPAAGSGHVWGHKAFTWRECVCFCGNRLPVSFSPSHILLRLHMPSRKRQRAIRLTRGSC